MQYKYINLNDKEQLCLLGRAILNDLLMENQSNVRCIFKDIEIQLTKQLLDFKTKKESLSQDILENLKISLNPIMQKLIIGINKYDDQKITAINALSEYIIDQMFIVPYYLLEQNRFFNSKALHDYYNQTGQTWFINLNYYKSSIVGYDASLSLDHMIQNIINQLLNINESIYLKEIKHKSEHIPLPKLIEINKLIDKLKTMITIDYCDGKLAYAYNKHQIVISELISILEYVQLEYDDLKEYMLANNISNILQIPTIARKVPEYSSILLKEKLPITTKELDAIFVPESNYRSLADIYSYGNYVQTTDRLNGRLLERIKLRSTNILCLSATELFLVRFDLRNLLENCIKVQCSINETELSDSLDFVMKKLEAGTKNYNNQSFSSFEQPFQKFDEKLLDFEKSKQLLQQTKLILSEEHQNRNALQKVYNDDFSMFIFQFNEEKSKIESQQQKEQLIKKLIENPLSLNSISKGSKEGSPIITITFDFIDLESAKRCLQLNECQCQEKFQRKQYSQIEDYRSKIESNIVKSILDNVRDKSEQINLACIGSDLFGLTIILAKLYKDGYTQFNIFNIEKTINYDSNIENMRKLKEIKRLDENCKKFWEWLFNNNQNNFKSTINFITIVNNNCYLAGNRPIQNKKIFLFAEDLSSMRYASQYNDSMTDVANKIYKNNPSSEVFLTQFDTKVYELTTLFVAINSQFKIRNSM